MTIEQPAAPSVMIEGAGVYDQSNSTVGAYFNGGGVAMDATTGGTDGLSVTIYPEQGHALSTGVFPIQGVANATHDGFDIIHGPVGCDATPGTVDIEQLSSDPITGDLSSFAASYSFICDREGSPITGELRWNSTLPYAAGSATPGFIDFRTVAAGSSSTATVTVTSEGPTPLWIQGSARIAGRDANGFAITADGCRGLTLTFGQTCTVTVIAHPVAYGLSTAVVELPDNSAGHVTAADLQVTGSGSAVGTYYPVSPTRILDTRKGIGATRGPVGPGATVSLPVLGDAGVPATGVAAVVLNLTVQGPTAASGYITAYPSSSVRPLTSNLNYTKGWTGANLVTVRVGDGGAVSLYNSTGSVNLIADVVGWYAADDTVIAGSGVGDGYISETSPSRLVDTRTWGLGPLPGGDVMTIPVDFDTNGATTANAAVRALAVNLTAVRPDGTGYLTAFDGASDPTTTSTLNYRAGTTVPNLAIVPTSTCTASACLGSPQISIYNGSLTPTDVVVDLVGVYVAAGTYGLRFHPFATPSRIVDTRSGIGRPALGVGMARQFWLPSQIADGDTQALLANVTAVKPTTDTYLTVSDSPLPHPATSTLNAPAGITVANAAPIPLSGQWFFLYNNAGLSNAVVDASGSFENAPGGTPFLARRAHDAGTDLSSVIGPVKHPKPGPPTPWNG